MCIATHARHQLRDRFRLVSSGLSAVLTRPFACADVQLLPSERERRRTDSLMAQPPGLANDGLICELCGQLLARPALRQPAGVTRDCDMCEAQMPATQVISCARCDVDYCRGCLKSRLE